MKEYFLLLLLFYVLLQNFVSGSILHVMGWVWGVGEKNPTLFLLLHFSNYGEWVGRRLNVRNVFLIEIWEDEGGGGAGTLITIELQSTIKKIEIKL